MKNLLKTILRRVVKVETLEVYDFDLKRNIKAEYVLVFGKYVTTVYN